MLNWKTCDVKIVVFVNFGFWRGAQWGEAVVHCSAFILYLGMCLNFLSFLGKYP